MLTLVAQNLTARYLGIIVDGAIGIVMLPFNVSHLGTSAYGLWALTTSVTWFFGVLDLGYGGALVKFIAQYRAWRDRSALNEILSTIGTMFAGIGALCFVVTLVIAWRIDSLFNIAPEQVSTARYVLLITGGHLSVRFACSIFGAVVYGFNESYRNDAVSIGTSVVIAVVNLGVLLSGHGLVPLVAATTAVRALSLVAFAWNAYQVYPGLHVRPSLFRRGRLKEVTGFSVYMLVLDWSAKLNYSADALVIGAFLNTAAIAVWTIGQRLAQIAQQITNQLNDTLFPAVVDSDAARHHQRLQLILVQGIKLSLALAAPLCVGLIMLADSLVRVWVGHQFAESVVPLQIMLLVVLVRASTSSATLILKGAGQHKLLAVTNASTAIVNVALSIALIHPLGLDGVAIGTLIPVTVSSMFVLYPAACRRVGIPVHRSVMEAMWPALWPAAIMAAALWPTRDLPPANLFQVALWLSAAGLLYAALFIGVASGAEERRFYLTKLRAVLGRRSRIPATL
jgi:O-antigen/teichoic acid export membrane protein